MIMQAVGLLDDLDKELNNFAADLAVALPTATVVIIISILSSLIITIIIITIIIIIIIIITTVGVIPFGDHPLKLERYRED